MEVQLGNPVVRNNLIILAGPDPYPADDSLLHVSPQNNLYYQLTNPDTVCFQESQPGTEIPGWFTLFPVKKVIIIWLRIAH
jgi:hypothetical protein